MQVYTDGACKANGKPNALGGIGVYWGLGHPLNVSKKYEGLQSNNRSEMLAATTAIEQAIAFKCPNLIVITDSKYLINSITKWVRKWKNNGWKTANGDPVKNRDDIRYLDELCSKLTVVWVI